MLGEGIFSKEVIDAGGSDFGMGDECGWKQSCAIDVGKYANWSSNAEKILYTDLKKVTFG